VDVLLVRFLTGVAEWVVYDALGALSPRPADRIDEAVADPLAWP